MSNTQIPICEMQNYMRGLVEMKGWTAYGLAKHAGIDKMTARRFMEKKTSMNAESTMKTMQALGFEIKLIKKQGRAAKLFQQLLGLGTSDLIEIT